MRFAASLAVVAALAVTGCASKRTAAAPTTTLADLPVIAPGSSLPLATTTTVRAPTPSPTTPVVSVIGTTTIDVIDPSRPTVANGRRLSSSRHLPTLVRYPALAGGVPAGSEAPAAPATGSWPLVIFAHGYNVTPGTYAHLLHAWAAAGFVVAAPAFPLETAGGPLDENDLNNEPRDISVVITAVLGSSLAGHIRSGHIAVTGHSDGAEAALGAGFISGDTRIGPVISMAAQGVDGMPHPDIRHPLLVVQGTQDTINPPARSDAVYADAGAPKFYLRLLGAGHLPPVADSTPWRPIVEQVSIDFLRRYLSGGNNPVAAMTADGNRPGLSTLSADP
jgi:hypothetical protein